MSDKTCKTCRFWGDVSHDWAREVNEGPSSLNLVPANHKPCGCPKIIYTGEMRRWEENRLPLDAALYSDSEGYRADFSTGPDFGCIHHEEKP